MDFVSNRTKTGLNIRVLTIVDEVTGECLAFEADICLRAEESPLS